MLKGDKIFWLDKNYEKLVIEFKKHMRGQYSVGLFANDYQNFTNIWSFDISQINVNL